MKLFKSLFLILFFVQMQAQTSTLTLLKGKITSQIKELGGVTISNLRSESDTTVDQNGNFSMFVKVGDTLKVSGLQIVPKKSIVSEKDLSKQLYVISVESKVIVLDEVEIKAYPNINAVSLGILQKPAIVYTPAERKLRTAGEFHWYSPLLIPIGGMSVDGLINSISGRTAMLKKELVIERKEKLLQKIEYMFKEEYFVENLKIPKEYIRGFWYYSVEDPKLVSALNLKNKMMSRFIFSDLAVKYLEIIKKQ